MTAPVSPRDISFDFRVVEDRNPEGFVVLKAQRDAFGAVIDFTFDYANEAAHRLLGAVSLRGRSFQQLADGRDQAQVLFRHAVRRLDDQGPVACQFERSDHKGVWLAASAFAIDPDQLAIRLRDISDRRAAETQLRTVSLELEHRIRNLLTVVTGIVRATAKHETDVASFAAHLTARLSALASVQSLILAAPDHAIGLSDLVEATLSPFTMPRLTTEGDAIQVPAASAAPLALALHELATNSLKYGGLSVADGWVKLAWREREGVAEIDWAETGGHPAQQVTNAGFGTNLINIAIKGLPKGMLIRRLEPDGLRVLMSFDAQVTPPPPS
jgi:two-component sensor histidine kinase